MSKTYLIATCLIMACGNTESATVQKPLENQPQSVVDSIFPVEEDIRRFKAARGGATAAALTGGASSREELVRMFVTALENRDIAALSNIVMNAAEFIDLYYPASIFAKPPYKQSPELRWFLMQENSNKGVARLLQRFGGKPPGYTGHVCMAETVEGQNTIHDRCAVTWSHTPATIRAFSTIIERDGRFKLVSYANGL